jgi:hypothetical protein
VVLVANRELTLAGLRYTEDGWQTHRDVLGKDVTENAPSSRGGRVFWVRSLAAPVFLAPAPLTCGPMTPPPGGVELPFRKGGAGLLCNSPARS